MQRPATQGMSNGIEGIAGSRRFPRVLRIRRPGAIRDLFDRGARCAGRYMVLWYLPSEERGSRIAVIAGKRTFRRAVDRNRAKRRLREVFRLNREHVQSGHDLMLLARAGVLGASFSELEAEFRKLLARARIAAAGKGEDGGTQS